MALRVYDDYFIPLDEEKIDYGRKISEKIRKMTGLDDRFLGLYEIFVNSANLDDGIVMFDEVKHRINKEMSKITGKDYDNEYKPFAEIAYADAVKEFRKRGLIKLHKAHSGTIYPQIIGYNYFDDPEFYVAYRKKGDTSWNGRFPASMVDHYTLCHYINEGYEIRENHILPTLLN
jgi:hypothetical protein